MRQTEWGLDPGAAAYACVTLWDQLSPVLYVSCLHSTWNHSPSTNLKYDQIIFLFTSTFFNNFPSPSRDPNDISTQSVFFQVLSMHCAPLQCTYPQLLPLWPSFYPQKCQSLGSGPSCVCLPGLEHSSPPKTLIPEDS